MAEEDDVWRAGDDDWEPYDDLDLGEPDYEQGKFVNRVFSIDVVFKAGLAMLQEQPILVLLAGLNLFLVQMIPVGLNIPVSVWLTVLQEQGQITELQNTLFSQGTSWSISLVMFPINQLIAAGAYVALGLYLRTDEVRIGALYSSIRPAVNGLLYAIVGGLVAAFGSLACLAPALAVIGLAIAIEMWAVALLALPLGLAGVFGVLYISLGLLLGPFAAVLDNRGPMEALRLSWQAAAGARVTLFVTLFAFGMANLVATCLCFFPIILVQAVYLAGFSSAWMLHARRDSDSKQWPFVERHLANL